MPPRTIGGKSEGRIQTADATVPVAPAKGFCGSNSVTARQHFSDLASNYVFRRPSEIIREYQQQVDDSSHRLIRAVDTTLAEQRSRLETTAEKFKLLSPGALLANWRHRGRFRRANAPYGLGPSPGRRIGGIVWPRPTPNWNCSGPECHPPAWLQYHHYSRDRSDCPHRGPRQTRRPRFPPRCLMEPSVLWVSSSTGKYNEKLRKREPSPVLARNGPTFRVGHPAARKDRGPMMEEAELPLEDVLKRYEEGNCPRPFLQPKAGRSRKEDRDPHQKDGRQCVVLEPFEAEAGESGAEESEDESGKLF